MAVKLNDVVAVLDHDNVLTVKSGGETKVYRADDHIHDLGYFEGMRIEEHGHPQGQ